MSKKIAPIHPGEHLVEFLEEFEVTPYRLAKEIHVPQTRIADIVNSRRGITADTALRLSKYFDCSAQYWLNLQAHYDLEMARDALGNELETISTCAA